jgi:hypothetical protein
MRIAFLPIFAALAIGAAASTALAQPGSDTQLNPPATGAQTPPVEQQLVSVWNPETCGFTNTAALTVSAPTRLTRLDLWYKWNPDETQVAYTLVSNGQTVFSGSLQRAECDAYQTSWCVARDTPNVDLAAGSYQVQVGREAICQNTASQGAGFIKAFGE